MDAADPCVPSASTQRWHARRAPAKPPTHPRARRTGSFQIWSYSSSGGNPQPVTSAAAGFGFALHPALSPDGRRLAFSGYVGGTWDVYVCDSKGGGNLVKLTNSPAGKLSMVPNWSPDGTRIAFESDREDASGKGLTAVYVMDASAPGAAPVRMTRSAQNDMGGWRLARARGRAPRPQAGYSAKRLARRRAFAHQTPTVCAHGH